MFLTFGSQQQTLENLCQTGVALEGQIHWAKKSITYFFSFNFERKKWPFSMHILYEKSH